ncbi:hypothetical protein Leryth_002696 [Lithospermum erythrorhizon]|uniref:Endoribonuclease n=1 Tax=Lithospermum erythrorhizon TaxID=34254 RepID=A0AAV3PSV5_LITER|nr:hypothetical protein Leryth_002696 [Lithospermum erythrorhizon]
MDRYQRVEKARPEEPINENEIRITAQGIIRNYISYATSLLQDKMAKEIVLKAMGQAISKTVSIAEIIKKRYPGLHQETAISSTTITDAYEPIEEGLQTLEMTRQVSLITIKLSTAELNKDSPGYQAPSDQKPFRAENQQPQRQFRQVVVTSTDIIQDPQGRGRGRGRGKFRGRGRGRLGGGYGNYQEDDGYFNHSRGGGRGGYGRYQVDGGYNNHSRRGGRGGYGRYQEDDGYNKHSRGGGRGVYGRYQEDNGYINHSRGGGRGGYGRYQEDDGYYNYGGDRGRGSGRGFRGTGYVRGRGGGRGFGRGRMEYRGRGDGYQA